MMINLKNIKDEKYVADTESEVKELLDKGHAMASSVLEAIKKRLQTSS